MGLVITREMDDDVVLELHHDRFTKYVYTAIDRRTHDRGQREVQFAGWEAAGKVAKRFLKKQVMQARGTVPRS